MFNLTMRDALNYIPTLFSPLFPVFPFPPPPLPKPPFPNFSLKRFFINHFLKSSIPSRLLGIFQETRHTRLKRRSTVVTRDPSEEKKSVQKNKPGTQDFVIGHMKKLKLDQVINTYELFWHVDEGHRGQGRERGLRMID